MKSEESGSGFMSGFLLGGLIGAAAALLLTPRSGEENRESLRERTIELRSRAEVAASKAIGEGDSLLARSKTVFEEQKARVQEAIDEGKESAADKKAEMMDRYRVSKETGEAPPPPIDDEPKLGGS